MFPPIQGKQKQFRFLGYYTYQHKQHWWSWKD